MIKKIRLILLVSMLLGSISMFNSTQSVRACGDEEGEDSACNCTEAACKPDGCSCCSDNHCKSGYCPSATDKCTKKPLDD